MRPNASNGQNIRPQGGLLQGPYSSADPRFAIIPARLLRPLMLQ